jgi:hypothetical protein
LPQKNEKGEYYVSEYTGTLEKPIIVEQIAKIKACFPQLPISFYSIFADRIKDKEFTNKQLIDSVNNVIDTCVYPVPTIANFLNFEKKKRAYTYDEVLKFIHENGGNITNTFDNFKVDNKTFWTLK